MTYREALDILLTTTPATWLALALRVTPQTVRRWTGRDDLAARQIAEPREEHQARLVALASGSVADLASAIANGSADLQESSEK